MPPVDTMTPAEFLLQEARQAGTPSGGAAQRQGEIWAEAYSNALTNTDRGSGVLASMGRALRSTNEGALAILNLPSEDRGRVIAYLWALHARADTGDNFMDLGPVENYDLDLSQPFEFPPLPARPRYVDELSDGSDPWPSMLRIRDTDKVIVIHRNPPYLGVTVYDMGGNLDIRTTEAIGPKFNNSLVGLQKAVGQIKRALSPGSPYPNAWDHLDES